MNFRRVVLFTILLFSSIAQAQTSDKRLMTDVEYKSFLLQVEAALPKWERDLHSIDPEKDSQMSYVQGKAFVEKRDLCLMEISNVRVYIAKERAKRTVSGELLLWQCLDSLFGVGSDIVWMEGIYGITLTHLDKYAPELSSLEIRAANDVTARVALLEKGTCH